MSDLVLTGKYGGNALSVVIIMLLLLLDERVDQIVENAQIEQE